MKEITDMNVSIPENHFYLSDKEIAVIHALCFYEPEGMTKEAEKVMSKLRKDTAKHRAAGGKFQVWK